MTRAQRFQFLAFNDYEPRARRWWPLWVAALACMAAWR
jgi:hypothetical protein